VKSKSYFNGAGVRSLVKPLYKGPFCPISASDSKFNPRNPQCMSTVKIRVFLAEYPY